jgi:hypothetical protein
MNMPVKSMTLSPRLELCMQAYDASEIAVSDGPHRLFATSVSPLEPYAVQGVGYGYSTPLADQSGEECLMGSELLY